MQPKMNSLHPTPLSPRNANSNLATYIQTPMESRSNITFTEGLSKGITRTILTCSICFLCYINKIASRFYVARLRRF